MQAHGSRAEAWEMDGEQGRAEARQREGPGERPGQEDPPPLSWETQEDSIYTQRLAFLLTGK